MRRQMVTANRLNDGAVVYLTESWGWSPDIADGRAVNGEGVGELMDRAEIAVTACEVVVPYAIEVELEGEGAPAVPVTLRERIRADGPTTA